MKALEEKYLEGLSELFPSIAAASTEIINLQAIVNGTFSDGYSRGI